MVSIYIIENLFGVIMKIDFKKSILLFSILLIFIVSIGSISASDMDNNADLDLADSHQTIDDQVLTESPLADDGDEGGSDPQNPQTGEGEGNDGPGGDTPTVKSYEEIQNQIDSANENDVIELNGSYAGDSFITVNKSLTIKGISEDTSLDLNENGQYFYVDGVNVIFENLKFINTNLYRNGSNFILDNYANCSYINCSFINCRASDLDGNTNGIIMGDLGTISIENCTFDNCAGFYIIESDLGTISIENSNFYNCWTRCLIYSNGTILINNSNFEKIRGNLVYSNNSDDLISNSNFTDCKWGSEPLYAGSFIIDCSRYCSNGSVINCNFINGDISMVKCRLVKDTTFTNCNYKYSSLSEICIVAVEVENCKFVNTTVRANITTTKIGSSYGNISLKLKLVDYFCGNLVPNQFVKFSFLDAKTYKDYESSTRGARTDQNGIATYKVPLDVGEYGCFYECFGPYSWSTNTFYFNITKAATIVNATKLTTTYNSGKTFNIKVLDKNTKKGVKGVKLSLKVYTGKKYKTYNVTTDKNGLAKFKASTLAIGSHKVVITGTNKNYVISKKESTIKINKAPTTVTAPKVTNNYKKSKYFKVTVINKATKKAVSSINVKIKVYTGKKYKIYTRKTNSKGLAKLNTKSLKKGKHKVVISSGNAKYIISKKSTIVIKK